jgi:hypothetical protein
MIEPPIDNKKWRYMDILNKCYKWVEPTMIIHNEDRDISSYILYRSISNFKINEYNFKLVIIELPNNKSNYNQYIFDYRIEYANYLKNLYPKSYHKDGGFDSILDAIKSTKDNLILLFKNFSLVGAASYSISEKNRCIDVSHIGVIERRKGYGSIMMKEILNMAKILHFQLTATSNGYADDFYHALGMIRIVDRPLGLYRIMPEYIMDVYGKP